MNDTKKILTEWRKYLTESGLSRVRKHIMEHDCAILTGFREDPTDMSNCTEQAIEAGKEDTNMSRNRELKAVMLRSGYGVTKVSGTWVEDFGLPTAKEHQEKSLFVVNLEDDPLFIERIIELGERYCQDAVLVLPAGGKGVYLIGTNNSEFPGLGEKIDQGNVKFGVEDTEFKTRVKGRPFSASPDEDLTEDLDTYDKLSGWSRMATKGLQDTFKKKIKDK